jgi:DNA-binding MarR family transcriptional regulator
MSATKNPPAAIPAVHRRIPQHLARRFAQICNALLSEVSGPYDLMPWHFALIVQISETPGMDRNWLANAIGADATSTGQALERFVQRGLVARSTNPDDRRASAYTLTADGKALLRKLRPQSQAVAHRLLAPLSAAETETLLDLLARLVEAHELHARPGAGRRSPRKARED